MLNTSILKLKMSSQLPHLIASHPDLAGINVTIPYKEQVIKFLDVIDETASQFRQ